MSKIITFIKDILAPKRCYGCQNQGCFLCLSCEKKIKKFRSSCYHCKKQTESFHTHKQCQKYIHLDQVIIYTHYGQTHISKLVKNGKFYNKKDIWEEVSRYYSQVLLKNISGDRANYVLVSVPMYRWKKYFRGYNQSEILVKHISQQTGITAQYNMLKKIRSTKQQSHLNKTQRLKNLEGSIKINEKLIDKYKHKTIIIIDDVVSTGSTLNNIAISLKNKGVHSVIACVFASD